MGKLWFDALDDSSYEITLIDPPSQRLVIGPPELENDRSCMAADLRSHGIQLNDNLPFNVSWSNAVVAMNCSSEVLQWSWNCSMKSPCHDYIVLMKFELEYTGCPAPSGFFAIPGNEVRILCQVNHRSVVRLLGTAALSLISSLS
ncbi:hypothetical protein TorRG33x02_134490 [Trema orientale]|uniref:Uncharacterized protein n=1 Tax=Trema orientale TaxID=63057 RepID=A0A2P5EZ47_TREOI|nr:hypothetical protein TorRG33x02_134490 [Trema orientale]